MRIHRLTLQAVGPFPGQHTVDVDSLSANGLFQLTLTGSQFMGMVILSPLLLKIGGGDLFFLVAAGLYVVAAVLVALLPPSIEPPLVVSKLNGARLVRAMADAMRARRHRGPAGVRAPAGRSLAAHSNRPTRRLPSAGAAAVAALPGGLLPAPPAHGRGALDHRGGGSARRRWPA